MRLCLTCMPMLANRAGIKATGAHSVLKEPVHLAQKSLSSPIPAKMLDGVQRVLKRRQYKIHSSSKATIANFSPQAFSAEPAKFAATVSVSAPSVTKQALKLKLASLDQHGVTTQHPYVICASMTCCLRGKPENEA